MPASEGTLTSRTARVAEKPARLPLALMLAVPPRRLVRPARLRLGRACQWLRLQWDPQLQVACSRVPVAYEPGPGPGPGAWPADLAGRARRSEARLLRSRHPGPPVQAARLPAPRWRIIGGRWQGHRDQQAHPAHWHQPAASTDTPQPQQPKAANQPAA